MQSNRIVQRGDLRTAQRRTTFQPCALVLLKPLLQHIENLHCCADVLSEPTNHPL